jgi:hypothetical protein
MDPVGVSKVSCRKFTDDAPDSDYILLPPKRKLEINSQLRKKLAAALVTRYSPDYPQMKILMTTTSKYIPESIHQWGQVQICDRGDWFKCRVLLKGQGRAHDCTYVKVSMSHPPSPSHISQLIVGL